MDEVAALITARVVVVLRIVLQLLAGQHHLADLMHSKWTEQIGMEDLGTFDNVPSRFSYATGISDHGSIIVGQSEYSGSYVEPCYWLNGSIHELLTLVPTSIELGEVMSISPNGH